MRGEAALTVRRTCVVVMPPLMGVVQARARRAHAQRRAAREADKRRGEEGARRAALGVGGPTRGLPRWWRQIVRTKAESQRIVATRPLCRVQYPVPYSSRLQVIHRPGSGNCDRSRLMQYGCAWLPPRGNRFPSGRDSNLEAFSYNPAHGSFAASPFPAAAIPMVRIGGSSRTEPNYRWARNSSRVKLTCLTTV